MLKKICTFTTGPVLAQLLTFAFLPIFTRVYSQSTIGEFQFISTCVLFMMPFINLGFNSLIVKNYDEDMLLPAYFTWLIPSAFIASLLVSFLSNYVGFSMSIASIFALYLYILSSSLTAIMYQYIVKNGMADLHLKAYVLFSAISNSSKIVFSVISERFSSILLAFILSGFLTIGILENSTSYLKKLNIDFHKFKATLLKTGQFQIQISFSQFVGIASEWIGIAALPFLGYSANEVAIASVAQLAVRSTMYPLGNAIYSVMIVEFQISPRKFLQSSKKIALIMLVGSCFISFCIYCFGFDFFQWILGTGWGGVGDIGLPLSIGIFAVIYLIPIARVFSVGLGQVKMHLWVEMLGLALSVIAIYLANTFHAEIATYFFWISLIYLIVSFAKVSVFYGYIINLIKKC